jgi:hypothetical protein
MSASTRGGYEVRTIDVGEFAISVQATIEEVETDGRPLLVTSGGRPGPRSRR